MCWCVDVLMCWCVDALMCWCVDVLMCWCVDVLMSTDTSYSAYEVIKSQVINLIKLSSRQVMLRHEIRSDGSIFANARSFALPMARVSFLDSVGFKLWAIYVDFGRVFGTACSGHRYEEDVMTWWRDDLMTWCLNDLMTWGLDDLMTWWLMTRWLWWLDDLIRWWLDDLRLNNLMTCRLDDLTPW